MSNEKTYETVAQECEEDLKEIASFYGGWDELRAIIKKLEDQDNERDFDAYMEARMDQASLGEQLEMAHRQQRDLK
jgi:hypothetical protein